MAARSIGVKPDVGAICYVTVHDKPRPNPYTTAATTHVNPLTPGLMWYAPPGGKGDVFSLPWRPNPLALPLFNLFNVPGHTEGIPGYKHHRPVTHRRVKRSTPHQAKKATFSPALATQPHPRSFN
jgi:hypothetical protein